ncbi:MAG: sulfite exporter TauE/SafE family protein [Betaproteobacteria bacterium]
MDFLPAAMLAAGLASGVHCVAMCGGIVAAFDGRRVIPIREKTDWARRIAFNLGRISTYAAAGAAAGTLGAAAYAAGVLPAQESLQIATSVMLVFVGLHLAGAGRILAGVEALGLPLWHRLQPAAARLLAGRTLPSAYAAGLAWGWLPCAMVYAALAAATFTGGAAQGALSMAAFGLGTLPFLLAAGWLASRLRAWRRVAGALLLGFGVFGLAHADAIGEGIRRGLLCL